MNIMNLESILEGRNSYFRFVEATGLLAALAIEVQMGVEMQIGGSAIVEAGRIARCAFVIHDPVKQSVFAECIERSVEGYPIAKIGRAHV